MTTEVLRNMLYADSPLLDRLAYVVMDEVHYLADRFRGAVWEEVIIHLPEEVRLVSLSATVSNAEEFGDWLQAVRGDTDVIVSEDRPVPLEQHVLVKAKLIDLFDSSGQAATNRVNPELQRLARAGGRSISSRSARGRRGGDRGQVPPVVAGERARRAPRGGRAAPRQAPAARDRLHLLPRGCDQAVRQVLRSGIRLTETAERDEIRAIVEERARMLRDEDLAVLGYWEWLEGLQRGVAAHHAGMLPAFKEVVEELFQLKLLKVVFATETLALGVNMPARSVVLEKLEKFNGEARVPITPGEYTQLTGRAGRRGIDVEGHSVIQWVDGLDPEAVASLASRRSYPLNSSFKPTYNMAVNLIDQFGRERTRQILELSFAQFQADRAVVDLARTLRKQEESMAGYEEAMRCHLGDFGEYAALRRRIGELERQASKGNPTHAQRERHAARARRGAQGDAGAPVPRLRRARAARAVGGALVAPEAGARPAVAADPHAHRAGREAVRPGHRGARAARLPRARSARLARLDVGGTHPEAHLRRTRPARRRVPAAGLLGRPRRAVARGDGGGARLRAATRRSRRAVPPAARAVPCRVRTHHGCLERARRPRARPSAGRQRPAVAGAGHGDARVGERRGPRAGARRHRARGRRLRALTKQVVDLLDQVSIVADAELGATARAAIDAVRRGVVAYGSVA